MKKSRIFLEKIKSIRHFFFKLLYGKIKNITYAVKNKKIKVKKIIFNKTFFYKLYNIPKGRIYSDTIMNTAFILNNTLVAGPSLQYKYKKNFQIINGNIKENFVNKNGTPKFLKKINGNIFSLLTGGSGKYNYWHWIFDVLPRIGILEKSNFKIKPDHYLIPSISRKYHRQTFEELKIPSYKLIDGSKYKHIICDNLIAVDHPINLNNNPTKSILNIPTWVIRWLRKNYIKKTYTNKNLPKKIFINREFDSNLVTRKIVNNEEVKNILIYLGFESISLSNLNFVDQVKLFKNANFIVGLHGGGFANMVFADKGTKIVEIASKHNGNVLLSLAKKCTLNYKRIIGINTSKKLKFQNSHVFVDVNKLKKLILSFN